MGARNKILVVDDDPMIRKLILSILLQNAESDIQVVEDGVSALMKAREWVPDLILLDVKLPDISGHEVCRRLKKVNLESLICFVTSGVEPKDVYACFQAGGDDYIRKPICAEELMARVKLHLTAKETLDQLNNEIAMRSRVEKEKEKVLKSLQEAHSILMEEQYFAKEVFDNIAHQGDLTDPRIKFFVSPFSIFNGDVLLASKKSDSQYHVMLGDFTGHGLPAAIGVLPTSDIFYSMTQKQLPLQQIVSECNMRLKKILPTGMFCAAQFLWVDFATGEFEVWAGGSTDILHFNDKAQLVQRIQPTHPALGILTPKQFDSNTVAARLSPGDKLYFYSDGIVEHRSPKGEMFGLDRMLAILNKGLVGETLFKNLVSAIFDFSDQTEEQEDDLSILEVTYEIPTQHNEGI